MPPAMRWARKACWGWRAICLRLIRLTTSQGRIVLLAEDMTYDKAGVMRLRKVRWERRPRGVQMFMRMRGGLLAGGQMDLRLMRMGDGLVGAACFRAPAGQNGFV